LSLRDTPLLAVLIDADNMSAKHADAIFLEIASMGEASIRRIYGDFQGGGPQGWTKEILASHAIIPHQQFAGATKRNASDIALVIDAMDILHSGRFDGFVIISSDSDFTRLASRIREQGIDVFGIGESKTPAALRKAYKKFILVENLVAADEQAATEKEKSNPPSKARPLLRSAIEAAGADGGWVPLGQVGKQLNANDPSFDPRAYGCPNLSTLARKAGTFEVKEIDNTLKIRTKT
jgi:hypothetical protein